MNNLGFTRVPVLCALTGTNDGSETFGTQLENEVPQTEGRASGATIAFGAAITVAAPGRIDLVCMSNTGVVDVIAQADGRQLTATAVGSIVLQ